MTEFRYGVRPWSIASRSTCRSCLARIFVAGEAAELRMSTGASVPFNGYYPESDVRITSTRTDLTSFSSAGSSRSRKPWRLPELYALPQLLRRFACHICVEGWSAIGKWSGACASATSSSGVGADLARQVRRLQLRRRLLTRASTWHRAPPADLLASPLADQILPPKYGFPMKRAHSTKLGFKNPKHITEIFVYTTIPGELLGRQGYNWSQRKLRSARSPR